MFKIIDTRTGMTIRQFPASEKAQASAALTRIRGRQRIADRASIQMRAA